MLYWDYSYITTALVAALTALVTYTYYKLKYDHYWKRNGIPFEPPVPLMGTFYGILRGKTLYEVDQELYQKHPKIFGAYEGTKPILYVSDPEYVKNILVKDFHVFTNRRELRTYNPVIDCMLSAVRDDHWKRLRTIMTPTFTTGKIKSMMPLIGECATQSVENFLKFADSGNPAECKLLFSNFTLDVIATTAFGTQLDSHNDPNNIFVKNAQKVFNRDMSWRVFLLFTAPKLTRKLGLSVFETKFFVDLTKSIVERRIKTKEVRNDFLQLLMEHVNDEKVSEDGKLLTSPNGDSDKPDHFKYMSTNELIAQSVIFFLAGYDTTATTLTMACYNMALNPNVQKKAQAEVDAIWAKHSVIDAEVISEAKYVDALVTESLRIFPPATRLERVAGEDYPLGNSGIIIPKNMLVAIPAYSMHKDPDWFPEPHEFRPERFLAENMESVTPMTYLPFGNGPRNCIAMRFALMEIKLCLIYLLKQVEFEICSETKIPPECYTGSGLYQPKAVHLKVTRRV